LYCVPHETIAGPPLVEDVAEASTRVLVTGVPLMPAFAAPPDAATTRRQLGFAADERVVLVLGGGLGLGLDDVVKTLLRDIAACTIVVVTGRNEDARRRLQVVARGTGSRLHVHGWTEHMERFIVAADLVIGKPGGLTVAEVLACGRPLLVTRSLRGQESFNVRFLERARLGKYIAEPELSECVTRLFADPTELQAMQQRAWRAGRRDGAVKIALRAVELASANIDTMGTPASGGINGHR
jgi:processive 1,2-diacylglycerol beta-glucosyltransferase